MQIFIRSFAVWFVLITVETVHGIARTVILQPWTGDFPARQIGVFTGSILILAVTYYFIDWIGARTHRDLALVGTLWVALTLAFEIGLGRLLFDYSWSRILSDFNIVQGGLLGLGMVVLGCAPLISSSFSRVKATPAERVESFPGDEFIAEPIATRTHAITIQGPRQSVWPWLVQMGANRAGWYSYDWLDNGGQRSAEQIIPDFQALSPGILFAAAPEATDSFLVLRYEHQRFLVLGAAPQGGIPIATWAFILKDAVKGHTRLITRVRVTKKYRFRGIPLSVVKWIHFIMQRKQLLGIARRAESL
jgi:hypothetical protein